jgi:ketosteroid isomerase-like protein
VSPRAYPVLFLLAALSVAGCAGSTATRPSQDRATLSTVRHELKKRYGENRRAFFAKDLPAIMALRTEDFVAVTPDSSRHERAEMEETTRALLDNIDRWISLSFQIDSLEVDGDLAQAVIRQHADRMARRGDSFVHHVESWVTQRETWRKTAEGWKLARVDNIRGQRRLIDGRPG